MKFCGRFFLHLVYKVDRLKEKSFLAGDGRGLSLISPAAWIALISAYSLSVPFSPFNRQRVDSVVEGRFTHGAACCILGLS